MRNVRPPGLAAITLDEASGGISYASRLIARALADIYEQPPYVVQLGRQTATRVPAAARARFAMRVIAADAANRTRWWLFDHAGLARAHAAVPAFLRRPYAVMLHDVEAWAPDLSPGRRQALRGARLRIANSRYTAERTMTANPDIGTVVPCQLGLLALRPTVASPRDAELTTVGTAASILIVARMPASLPYKGHDQLIDAWPAVLARAPHAELLIAGKGDDLPRLQARAAALGVAGAVRFLGYVPEHSLQAMLRRVAAFAMPSGGEGFGLVYLEAMRAGLPCIASTADAAGDIVLDGETGYLVDRADSAQLAARVVALLQSDSLRRTLGENGRARFDAQFTYEAFRERLRVVLAAMDRPVGERCG